MTRKIARALARIKCGLQDKLYLGNLDARRDWGYAPEYVEAMWMMLQQDTPQDYVIGTGSSYSVREFVQLAFSHVNLDWNDYVTIDPLYYRPAEVDFLLADASKAHRQLGWKHRVECPELVKIMVDAELHQVAVSPADEPRATGSSSAGMKGFGRNECEAGTRHRIQGQDGSYLTELLDEKGYQVTGVDSSGAVSPASRDYIATVDMRNESEVLNLIAGIRPDEIYYLAAYHHSSEAGESDPHELLQASFDINTLALNHVLQAGRKGASGCRIFYAASSRIFGNPETSVQNENSRFNPECAYGISKAAGVLICRYYRKEHGVRCSTGILYNHESPRRRAGYISKKIVSAAVAIKQGRRSDLVVGSLDARVDWGFAPDYVSAMCCPFFS